MFASSAVLLFLFFVPSCVLSMVAINEQTRTALLNNKLTSFQTVTFVATELDHSGSFSIGECTATLYIPPPVLNYFMIVGGNIPAYTTAVLEDACTVANLTSYQEVLQSQGLELDLVYTDDGIVEYISELFNQTVPVEGGRRRRLLQTAGPGGGAEDAVKWKACGNTQGTSQSCTFQSNAAGNGNGGSAAAEYLAANALDADQLQLQQLLKNFVAIDWLMEYQILNQTLINKLVINAMNLTQDQIALLLQRNQNSDKAIEILLGGWIETYDQLAYNVTELYFQTNMLQLYTNTSNQMILDYTNNQGNFNTGVYAFLNTTLQLITDIVIMFNQTTSGLYDGLINKIQDDLLLSEAIFGAIEGLRNLRQVDQAILTQYIEKNELHALQSALAYLDFDSLPPNFNAYWYNEGVRPLPNNLLNGPNTRVMMDAITVNWVHKDPTSGVITVGSDLYYVYFSTNYALQFYAVTLDAAFLEYILEGDNENCTLAYYDPTMNLQFINNTRDNATGQNPNFICDMWIIMNTTFCSYTASGTFDWSTQSAFVNGDPQLYANIYCQTNNPVTNNFYLLRSTEDLNQALQVSYNNTYRTTYFSSFRLQSRMNTFPTYQMNNLPLSGGGAPYGNSQLGLLEANLGGNVQPGFLAQFISILVASFPFMQGDISTLRMIKFGRTPGIDAVSIPSNIFNPTKYNPITGEIIYDADSTPTECIRSRWNAYSQQTLPLTNFIQNSATPLTTQVIVNLQCPPCLANQTTVCYTITNENITINVNSVTYIGAVPDNFLTTGNVDSATMTEAYDPPFQQMITTPVIDARKNTISYILMPPDVQTSYTMDQFLSVADNIKYDPYSGGVSAQAFRVGLNYTTEGYPYCSIWRGEPDNTSLIDNSTSVIVSNTTQCVAPFTWSIPIFPMTNYQSFTSTIAGCQWNYSYPLHDDNFNKPSPSTLVTQLNGNFTVSFWYSNTPPQVGNYGNIIPYIIQLNASDYLVWYVQNGVPGIQKISSYTPNTFDTSNYFFIPYDLRDGYSHFITWTIMSVNNNLGWSLQLYTDTLLLTNTTVIVPLGTKITSANLMTPAQLATFIATNPSSNVKFQSSTLNGAIVPNDTTLVYSSVLLASDIRQQYICQPIWRTQPRCMLPSQSAETIQLVGLYQDPLNPVDNCYLNGIPLVPGGSLPPGIPDSSFPTSSVAYSPFILSMWAKCIPNTNYVTMVGAGNTWSLTLFTISNDGTTCRFGVSLANGGTLPTAQTITTQSDNQYHLLSAGVDRNFLILFYDGVYKAYNTFGGTQSVSPLLNSNTAVSVLNSEAIQSVTLYSGVYGNDGLSSPVNTVNSWVYGGVLYDTTYVNNRVRIFQILMTENYECQVSQGGDQYVDVNTVCTVYNFGGTSSGYCYLPTLCSGHCEYSYVTINQTALTYIPLSSVCDLGWTPLTSSGGCYQLCTRLDPISHMCLDQWLDSPNNTQNGLIAGASWCGIQRNFRYYGIGEQALATFSPYHYNIQFTLILPSGVYQDIITSNNETCPFISLYPDSNSQLWLNIENNELLTTSVIVAYAPLNNTGVGTCDVSNVCCNLPGTVVNVGPRNTYRYFISACGFGTMSINVSIVTNALSPFFNTSLCFEGQGQSLLLSIQNALSTIGDSNNGIYSFNITQVENNQIFQIIEANAYTALQQYSRVNAITTQNAINNLEILIQAAGSNQQLVAELTAKLVIQQERLVNLSSVLNYTTSQIAYYQEQLYNIQIATFSPNLDWKINTTEYALAIGDILTENVVIDGKIVDIMEVVREDLGLANDTNNYIIELGQEVLALNAINEGLIGTALQELIDIEDERFAGAVDYAIEENNRLSNLEESSGCGCGFFESISPSFTIPEVEFGPLGSVGGGGVGNSHCTFGGWLSCQFSSLLGWLVPLIAIICLLCCLWQCAPALLSCCQSAGKAAKNKAKEYDKEVSANSRAIDKGSYSKVDTSSPNIKAPSSNGRRRIQPVSAEEL